jgi:hypothetical protein
MSRLNLAKMLTKMGMLAGSDPQGPTAQEVEVAAVGGLQHALAEEPVVPANTGVRP